MGQSPVCFTLMAAPMTVGAQGHKYLVSDLNYSGVRNRQNLTAEPPPAFGDTKQFAKFLYDLDELASPSQARLSTPVKCRG